MKKISAILIVFLMFACSPQTKDDYLKEFDEFMTTLVDESDNYSKKDWSDAEKKFILLSQDWYYKFEDELTWDEKLKVKAYVVQFNLIKAEKFIDDITN